MLKFRILSALYSKSAIFKAVKHIRGLLDGCRCCSGNDDCRFEPPSMIVIRCGCIGKSDRWVWLWCSDDDVVDMGSIHALERGATIIINVRPRATIVLNVIIIILDPRACDAAEKKAT
jgi:hypothetical protein